MRVSSPSITAATRKSSSPARPREPCAVFRHRAHGDPYRAPAKRISPATSTLKRSGMGRGGGIEALLHHPGDWLVRSGILNSQEHQNPIPSAKWRGEPGRPADPARRHGDIFKVLIQWKGKAAQRDEQEAG